MSIYSTRNGFTKARTKKEHCHEHGIQKKHRESTDKSQVK